MADGAEGVEVGDDGVHVLILVEIDRHERLKSWHAERLCARLQILSDVLHLDEWELAVGRGRAV